MPPPSHQQRCGRSCSGPLREPGGHRGWNPEPEWLGPRRRRAGTHGLSKEATSSLSEDSCGACDPLTEPQTQYSTPGSGTEHVQTPNGSGSPWRGSQEPLDGFPVRRGPSSVHPGSSKQTRLTEQLKGPPGEILSLHGGPRALGRHPGNALGSRPCTPLTLSHPSLERLCVSPERPCKSLGRKRSKIPSTSATVRRQAAALRPATCVWPGEGFISRAAAAPLPRVQ